MKKFVIVSPKQVGGGPIVLHLLCKMLCDKGYNAKIFYLDSVPSIKYNEEYLPCSYSNYSSALKYFGILYYMICKEFIKFVLINTMGEKIPKLSKYLHEYEPVKGCKRKFLPFVGKDTVVIYPEICYGNILHSKKTVRWLLYHNRFKNDSKGFDENDLVICYRKVFNDPDLNPSERTLHLVNFDFDMYKQTNFEERSGCCYVIRKGYNRSDLPQKFDGPILDNLPEQKIVEALNTYKYCYFYDTQTFYASIAAICGCIPIVICEPGKNKNDYCPNEETYGIAYADTDDEIQYALSTRHLVIEYINQEKLNNEKNINEFIELCDEFFFNKNKYHRIME